MSEANHGYQTTDDRRKVMLWSREPWSDVDPVGSLDLPSGRFVIGCTSTSIGPIRVVGVCIPWRDAHVRTGRCDRKPWQDHSDFIFHLGKLLSQLDDSTPIIVVGDFNQRIPRIAQPMQVFDQLQNALADRFQVVTAGVLSDVNEQSIDHAALSRYLTASELQTFNGTSEDSQHLSDHFGLSLQIRLAKLIDSTRQHASKNRSKVTPQTIGESLHWSYANLAMAHAAVTQNADRYSKTHFMIRARMYAGLNGGTMSTASLIEDERLKLILPQACCYCGARKELSLDHLFATKRGGSDSGDNIVWACRSCNSSKGARDVLLWMNARGDFPPLLLLRRYLKLAIEHCRGNGQLQIPLGDVIKLPFALEAIPHAFPPLSTLRLWQPVSCD